jgi:hypothetical protein
LEFHYGFSNSYVVVDDTLIYNGKKLESVRRDFRLTDEFEKRLVESGLDETIREDLRYLRVRYGIGVDASVDWGLDVRGTGVGAELDFVNLKALGVDAGIRVGAYVVPEDLKSSHVSAGLVWRPVRNVGIAASYSRSVGANMVSAGIVLYPFD